MAISGLGTDGHAKVVLDAVVPGVVVGCVQVDPFFIGHRLAPAEKGQRIGSDGMAQLPGSAIDYFEDFVRDEGWLSRVFE